MDCQQKFFLGDDRFMERFSDPERGKQWLMFEGKRLDLTYDLMNVLTRLRIWRNGTIQELDPTWPALSVIFVI